MTISQKGFVLSVAGLVLLGAGCFGGDTTPTSRPNDLPDHITEVYSTTLPDAIDQARRQSKTSVLVTDPTQEDQPYIRVSTNTVTETSVYVSTRRDIEDPVQFLKDAGFDNLAARNVVLEEGGGWSMDVNTVKSNEIAVLVYEIFNGIMKFQSTTNWVIDLEA